MYVYAWRFADASRCTCPPGFSYHVLLGRCEDFNECAGAASSDAGPANPCGHARCQNSIGSYACTCPTGYQYNLELRICVQAALGCSRVRFKKKYYRFLKRNAQIPVFGNNFQASCMFGCNPVGTSGYSCGCPRGYKGLGRDSCMAVGNVFGMRHRGDSTSPKYEKKS